jgi:hypothetical protein
VRLLFGLLLFTTICLCQTYTPFTVTEVSRQFDTTGKLTSESRFLFAYRQDGSIVSVDHDPRARNLRQILDASKHQTLLIEPTSRSASQMPYNWPPSSGSCDARFHAIAGAVVSVDNSPRTVSGVPVQRVSAILPGGVLMEVLIAPDLACQMLESTISQNGRILSSLVSENLRIGNPDAALFKVPLDYRLTKLKIP